MKNYDTFYNTLKEKGYKFTKQRKVVFETIVEHEDRHLTIEELYKLISLKDKNLGLTTVYRSVQIFCDLNLLEKINIDDSTVRYELNLDSGNHRHHHLICSKCNKIIEVKEDLMDSIEKIFEETYDFLVTDHQTKFFGLCKKCRNEKITLQIE